MEADGTKHIAIGGLLFLAGAGASLVGYVAVEPGSRYVVFTGLIIVGGFEFLFGLGKYLEFRRSPRPRDPFKDAKSDFRILFRTMVAVAELRGNLDQDVIRIVQSILFQVYSKEFEASAVADGCKALWGDGEAIFSHLFDAHVYLTIEFRRTVVRAAAVIFSLGGVPMQQQREFLLYASRALQLNDNELNENLRNCHQLTRGS